MGLEQAPLQVVAMEVQHPPTHLVVLEPVLVPEAVAEASQAQPLAVMAAQEDLAMGVKEVVQVTLAAVQQVDTMAAAAAEAATMAAAAV
jgi:hypothetical protein